MSDINYSTSGGTLGGLTFVFDPSGTTGHPDLFSVGGGSSSTESGSDTISLSALQTNSGEYELGMIVSQQGTGTADPVELQSLTITVNGSIVYSLTDYLGGATGVLLSDNNPGANSA